MNSSILIRLMRVDDLPRVLEIQSECYTEVAPESEQSIHAKVMASPSSCYVAVLGPIVIGYLISVPGKFGCPPALDSKVYKVPNEADSLYLHDLAVAVSARSTGAGRALVEKFLSNLDAHNFNHASLIAVQNSAPYWRQFGFVPVAETPELQAKLLGYGDNAQYMEFCPDESGLDSGL